MASSVDLAITRASPLIRSRIVLAASREAAPAVDQSVTQPRGAVDLDPVVSSELIDPLLKVGKVLRSTCDPAVAVPGRSVALGLVLGEAVAGAGRTDTFLGARYRRLVRRRGKNKAIVAVGRSLLVIIWHLLADPDTRFHELGADHYDRHVNTHAKRRNHVRQLEALGYRVTLEPAA
jgi:hypothetical protein